MIRRITHIVTVLIFGLVCFAFGQRSVKINSYIEAREAAPDKAQFDRNFEAMNQWVENYKKEQPEASDQEIQAAYTKALEGAKGE